MVQKVKHHLPRFVNALIFGCAFAFLGWVIPTIFYTYFDTNEYYIAKFDMLDKKEYSQCDTITFTISRDSKVKSGATFNTTLVHLTELQEKIPVTRRSGIGDIIFGKDVIANVITIPCDAPPGFYLLYRSVIYKVFDREKVFNYESKTFLIKQKGADTK